MLAGRGFDAEKLNHELNAIELKASYEPLEPLGATDIEEYLRHHHDMVVLTAVLETGKETDEFCDELAQKQLDSDWELAKKSLIEDMGHYRGKYEVPNAQSMSLIDGRSRKRLTYGDTDTGSLSSAIQAVTLMRPSESVPAGALGLFFCQKLQ